jgi:anaerobic dimethyl sulfoxide reductase subunit B (iron-sulfur subunit)
LPAETEEADIIQIKTYEEGVYPNVKLVHVFITCFHCEKPACMEVCPEGVISKRPEDGIVLVENIENCSWCGLCIEVCPYNAPKLMLGELGSNDNRFVKCDLCIDQLEQDKAPLCARACSVEAIKVGPIDEFKKQCFLRVAEKYPDYRQTLPSIFFVPKPT